MEGHNEPCYYCGKPCNSFAGYPSEWPIPLSHSDEPGKVKWHHTGCVSKRLHLLDEAYEVIHSLLGHNFIAIDWLKKYEDLNK
jgi:hypothetical protein